MEWEGELNRVQDRERDQAPWLLDLTRYVNKIHVSVVKAAANNREQGLMSIGMYTTSQQFGFLNDPHACSTFDF